MVGLGACTQGGQDDAAATTSTTTQPPSTTTTTAPPATTTTTTVALPTEPAAGGVVTVGVSADLTFGFEDQDGVFHPPTINPFLDSNNGAEIARFVVPGAYRIDAATGEFLPWLVESLPTVANGGVVVEGNEVTVTWTVREEAVWEDGTPITAADLAFTHDLIMDEALPIDNLRVVHEVIESVAAEGKTLTALLAAPSPDYERAFEWILPAHVIDPTSFVDDWNESLWLSGGPFRFVSLTPAEPSAGEEARIALAANDAYWERDPVTGQPLPYLEGLELRVYSADDSSSPVAQFTSGGVDLHVRGIVLPHNRGLLPDAGEVAVEWDTLFEVMTFQLADSRFEVNPDSHNEVREYREAVLSAIDRYRVAEDSSELAVSGILGIALDRLEQDAWARYDNSAAVPGLLAAAGISSPTAAYVSSSGEVTIAIGESVAAQLTDAGITTTTDFSGDFFGTQLPNGLTDMGAVRLFAGPGMSSLAAGLALFDPNRDDDFLLTDWSSVGEPADRYSEIMELAATTVDHADLEELLLEAETILADHAIAYPLVRRQPNYRPYWPDRIQGFVPNRFQGWDTGNAAFWWSPEGAAAAAG